MYVERRRRAIFLGMGGGGGWIQRFGRRLRMWSNFRGSEGGAHDIWGWLDKGLRRVLGLVVVALWVEIREKIWGEGFESFDIKASCTTM